MVLFNSVFENALRVLHILVIIEKKLTLERIVSIDFISIYGKDFGVSKINLHGNNSYNFSEFSLKREQIKKALKLLVLEGYVTPKYLKKGFFYMITKKGKNYCNRFNNNYSETLSTTIKNIGMKYENLSDRRLTNLVNEMAILSIGSGI